MDLRLYHADNFVPVSPYYGGNPYVAETVMTTVNRDVEKLSKEAAALKLLVVNNQGYRPQISFSSDLGSLRDTISAVSGKRDVHLVVMGGRSGSALDHFLGGSNTTAATRHAWKPVLIIPEKCDLGSLDRVVFATNFSAADKAAVYYLMKMRNRLGFQLDVVHVIRPGNPVTGIEGEAEFREYLDTLSTTHISYQHLFGDEVFPQLKMHCNASGSPLLAMTHAHHDIITRMVMKSETKIAMKQHELAVLIFPPDFKDKSR